jgi:hypothetical protein
MSRHSIILLLASVIGLLALGITMFEMRERMRRVLKA